MKKIFFLLLIITQISLAEQKVYTVATVNDNIITNIDIKNEIEIIKILNKEITDKIENINNFAINSLIEDHLKKKEIEKNKIEINKYEINQKYYEIINFLKIETENLSENLKNKLFDRIKRDLEWNVLISKLYTWKISVNMDEIDQKIKSNFKNNDPKENYLEKEKVMSTEKNKKLNTYSQNHLNNLRKNSIIKIYK